MIIKKISDIVQMVSGEILGQSSIMELLIEGVSTDTRSLKKGQLFVPLIGPQYNGHDYVHQAVELGASAVLWQRGQPLVSIHIPVIIVEDTLTALQLLAHSYINELNIRVVAVTGSNGKTTTKDMIASVLATTYRVHKSEGNLNNHIGLPLTLLKLSNQVDIAVLEMGMSGRGEIECLSRIAEPEVAVITNIGEAHMLQLGSKIEIARAKMEITTGLKSGGIVIYNGDEPLIEEAGSELAFYNDLKKVTYGQHANHDWRLAHSTQTSNGLTFTVAGRYEMECTIPLFGDHNALNAVAAVAVGHYFAVPNISIQSGLQQLQPPSMRSEMKVTPKGTTLINDTYNANPTSMKAAIKLLADLKGYKRKIMVISDMLELGANEVNYHKELGQFLLPEEIQVIYTYGWLSQFTAEMVMARYPKGSVLTFDNQQQLIQELINNSSSEDVILLKGSRGMKLERVVAALMEG